MNFNGLTATRWGMMIYHRNDFFIGRSLEKYGDFAPEETDLFKKLVEPGSIVIDGGANQGAFTVPLAKMVGEQGGVFAIEPQRLTYQVLCGNLAINSLANVHAIHAALGSENGATRIPIPDLRTSVHTGEVTADPAKRGERVQVITIDSLGLSRLALLKLDIEGHERAAIQGARRTIAAHKPVIYVENDKPEHFRELIADIRNLDYRLFWHFSAMFPANNWQGETENIFAGIVNSNMLCLPPDDHRDFGLPPVTEEIPRHLGEAFDLLKAAKGG